MSSVKRFEDLVCWQKARELVKAIYNLTRKPSFSRDLSLKDQIQRAGVSIMSNLAEGFERGTKDEFLYFLYIAKGSAGEVRTQLYIAQDLGYISGKEFNFLNSLTQKVSSLIYRLIESLKSSKYKGLKFKVERKPLEFEKELEKILQKKNLS